jgi:hypothetical protein
MPWCGVDHPDVRNHPVKPCLQQYIYHNAQTGKWGDGRLYSGPPIVAGRVYEIVHEVTVGSRGKADGRIVASVDGVRCMTADRLSLRSGDHGTNILFLHWMTGGQSATNHGRSSGGSITFGGLTVEVA